MVKNTEGVVTSRDNDKLLNGDNNLELFKEVMKLIHRNDEKPRQWKCHTLRGN